MSILVIDIDNMNHQRRAEVSQSSICNFPNRTAILKNIHEENKITTEGLNSKSKKVDLD